MRAVKTWTATIWIGTRVGYGEEIVSRERIEGFLQKYVDETSFCVTLTPTTFIYKNGNEPGFAVGLIHYPRFPSTEPELENRAIKIAEGLKATARHSGAFP